MNRTACLSAALVLTLAACAEPADEASTAEAPAAMAQVADADLPNVLVFKSPTCLCCNGWIEHMEAAGFTVDARDTRDVMSVKIDAGVPTAMSSCHTAIIDGYVVEGHVPPATVRRMLAERPEIAGIGVPGMPIGSPGMEGPNPQPYEVFSFDRQGGTAVYAEIDPR